MEGQSTLLLSSRGIPVQEGHLLPTKNSGHSDTLEMSHTLPYALLREPKLLDVVDLEWARDTLPDDGECK